MPLSKSEDFHYTTAFWIFAYFGRSRLRGFFVLCRTSVSVRSAAVYCCPEIGEKCLFRPACSKNESEFFRFWSQSCLLYLTYKNFSPVQQRSTQQDSQRHSDRPRGGAVSLYYELRIKCLQLLSSTYHLC